MYYSTFSHELDRLAINLSTLQSYNVRLYKLLVGSFGHPSIGEDAPEEVKSPEDLLGQLAHINNNTIVALQALLENINFLEEKTFGRDDKNVTALPTASSKVGGKILSRG